MNVLRTHVEIFAKVCIRCQHNEGVTSSSTHLLCLQGEGVPEGDPLDGEDLVGGSQEEVKDPELLEEVEVSCTSDLLVLETYTLKWKTHSERCMKVYQYYINSSVNK